MYRIKYLYYFTLFVFVFSGAFMLKSCYKLSGPQTIPAYVQIDSVYIETDYPGQGSNSHKVTDVWVYLNKDLLGVFELPAIFPVLAAGINDLEIRPGIWLNGIQSTRVTYPFYKPIVYDAFDFFPDSVHNLADLKTTYYGNLDFAWKEDFEQTGLSLVETSVSDTVIRLTSPANSPDAFVTPTSKYSGVISLTEEKPIYSATSMNTFPMPDVQGDPVLMELNFKSNNLFHVGLLMNQFGGIKKVPLLIMNPTDKWKKIYINLGPNIALNSDAANYKVYFEAGLETSKSSAKIYLDNIKLIYRQYNP